MANHDTNMNDLDDTSTTSSLGELVTGVQTMFEQLIACSDTTSEGSYIIERDVMANALHSLTDLFDAIDAREEGKTPSPDTSNASLQQVLDRLGAIEKQVQRIQHAHVPKPSRQPEASRLRFSLILETARIQSERNRNTGELQAPRATPAAPVKKSVGRPTDISKAGAAAGQRALQWQATAVQAEDAMEE